MCSLGIKNEHTYKSGEEDRNNIIIQGTEKLNIINSIIDCR